MRLPVSTPGVGGLRKGRGSGVFGGVVRLATDPGAPEDAGPGAGQAADGVGVVAAARAGALVDVGGPGALVAGVVGMRVSAARRRLLQAQHQPTPLDSPLW